MSLSSKWECLVTVPATDQARLERILRWLTQRHFRHRAYHYDWRGQEQVEVLVLGRDMARIRQKLSDERGPATEQP